MAQRLNLRRQRFVAEYLADPNGAQAAIRAGYSPRTARHQASELLANPDIRLAILQGSKRQQEEAGVNAAWLLKRLADLAQVDIADLFEEDGVSLRPLESMPAGARRLIAGFEVQTLPGGRGVLTKVKLMDRVKLLELIGKHIDVGALRDRVLKEETVTVIVRNYTGRENGRPGRNGQEGPDGTEEGREQEGGDAA